MPFFLLSSVFFRPKRFYEKRAELSSAPKKVKSRPISRVLSGVAIYLHLPLPTSSSDVLRSFHGKRPYVGTTLSCFGWGLHCTARYRTVGELLPRLFTLTGRDPRGIFCCTFPEVAFGGRYPSPCFMKLGLSSLTLKKVTAATQPALYYILSRFYEFVNYFFTPAPDIERTLDLKVVSECSYSRKFLWLSVNKSVNRSVNSLILLQKR